MSRLSLIGKLWILMMVIWSCSPNTKTPLEAPLSLEFEYLTTAEYNGSGELRANLSFKNVSKDTLKSGDWTIYFNGHGIGNPDTTLSEIDVKWLNGDFNQIKPTEHWVALAPGEVKNVQVKIRNLQNRYNVPRGFYFVSDNYPEGIDLEFLLKPNPHLDAYDARVAMELYERNERRVGVQGDLPPVFPTPKSYTWGTDSFDFNNDLVIVSQPWFNKEAIYLRDALENLLGKRPEITDAPKENQSVIYLTYNEEMKEEEYRLAAVPLAIQMTASTVKGMFYSVQSLLNMIHPKILAGDRSSVKIRGVIIEDEPRFAHRAFMLDVARNFQKKEQIFKLLDLLAAYKINVFHFHLTEDEAWRLEIPGLPELTDVGAQRGHSATGLDKIYAAYGSGATSDKGTGSGYYTREDFIEILKYADARYIKVIPEIETPGHARAAIKAMEARYHKFIAQGDTLAANEFLLSDLNDQSTYRSPQAWTDNVMNVAMPSVYTFMRKVVDEIILMYKEANVKLETVHIGGDEVPNGVWEKSPVVEKFLAEESKVPNVDELWFYYLDNMERILKHRGLNVVYGWEEIGMKKALVNDRKTMVVEPRFGSHEFRVDVWNNVGANVDLAYRLANAGYKVVLTNVTNFYYDLAYNHGFYEMGHNWGGLVDVEKSFRFIPFDYYKSILDDRTYKVQDQAKYRGLTRLTEAGKANIIGLQAPLWTEFVSGPERMEYMILPKLFGLVERAWAPAPKWETMPLNAAFDDAYLKDWSVFLDRVGHWELPRLDYLSGGFNYRVPTPGIALKEGRWYANTQFPGLEIRYTLDGSEPTAQSTLYEGPISSSNLMKFKVFNQQGRGSSTITVDPNLLK
jgi:hexosaminidase